MSEHTAFVMSCELKKNTPQQVIDTLRYMSNLYNDYEEFDNYPSHPFFETEEWEHILGAAGGLLWDAKSTFAYDDITKVYRLNIRCSFKDHEYQIPLFLQWLSPYIRSKGYLGYMHPEYQALQTRILLEKGRFYLVAPVENTPGLEAFTQDAEAKKMEEFLNTVQLFAKDNPELPTLLMQQLESIELMAPNNLQTDLILDDSQYKAIKEALKDMTREGEEDKS